MLLHAEATTQKIHVPHPLATAFQLAAVRSTRTDETRENEVRELEPEWDHLIDVATD